MTNYQPERGGDRTAGAVDQRVGERAARRAEKPSHLPSTRKNHPQRMAALRIRNEVMMDARAIGTIPSPGNPVTMRIARKAFAGGECGRRCQDDEGDQRSP